MLDIILSQLEAVAFEFKNNAGFEATQAIPDWFIEICEQKQAAKIDSGKPIALGQMFPFIENFMFEAKQIWENSEIASVRSGIWTEVINDSECYFDAVAINAAGIPILLIINETSNFDVRHKVFQNARNLALKNEKLEHEMLTHQRKLQKNLEKYYLGKRPNSEVDKTIARDIEQESSAVMICKEDGGVEVYNKALIDIYALPDTEISKQSLLQKWTREAEKLYPEISRTLDSGNYWEGEFESTDHDNNKKWVRLIIAPVLDDQLQLTRYICVANDVSELRLSASELERITQIDSTTKLPNRKNFWKFLGEHIEQNEQTGEPLALFYIDLDHFKQVNDDLGPQQADFLLSTVASRLKRCLKQQDYVAHLGGDEFAVIISRFDDQQALIKIAERINSNIHRDVSFSDFTLNVSASIGISIYPNHGLKSRQLVKSADYAMYQAKEMGRNQFQFSSVAGRLKIKSKLHIEQGLKKALVNNEFELYYQPQICLGKVQEHRLEALIRWNHPNKGTITPADFISIAEESGLIIDIGRWVLTTACQQIKRLNSEGIKSRVSINVSPKQFKFSNLTEDVKNTLAKFSIPAAQLELEVTESLLLEDMDNVLEQLKKLKALGVSISIDDFGTGYSSLSYLKTLPVNNLKIDRSFIQELPHNNHSRTIVETVIKMAHKMSLEVIAEGIENHQQFQYLRDLGCDFVQGYLFHAPLSSDELLALYNSLSPSARS